MPSWDEAADWYLEMVGNDQVGFNQLAADTALELVGPCAGVDVLDVGCGEGHVSRRLAAMGARVVAIEPVERLLAAGLEREAEEPLGITYRLDRAEELGTIADASTDAVVAVLVLHHVGDLTRALTNVRRVLRAGGDFVAVIPHPWTDHPAAGWTDLGGRYRRTVGEYSVERYWTAGDTSPTATMHSIRQIGWHHRTLATFMSAVAAAGFGIHRVLEPTGDASRRNDGGGQWSGLPRFLALSAS
jgi:SAM-dependent methyltransferase